MVENSFEALNYLTPRDQDPAPGEEDFKEIKRETSFLLNSGLQNEVGDFVNGYKENSWKNIDPEDCFPNLIPTVELDSPSKNYFPREDDDLLQTLSLVPNVTCPTGLQNLPSVTRNYCSGMKVEKHIGNRHNLALDTQDLFAETPCSFMKKREMIDKSLSNEPVPCYQRRTSDVLREKQGVHKTKNNYWAFFTANLSNKELQVGPDKQSYFGSWPEGTHMFVCEQRPKKDRSRKLTCAESREQLIKLISTSEGASGPGSSPEISIEEMLLIENEDLSSSTETTDSFIETETNIFRSSLLQLDIPKSFSEPTKNKKKIQKRILNLAPNFNLLEQSNINGKEKDKYDLLIENYELSTILVKENDKVSEINNKKENRQKVMAFNNHPLWFFLGIIEDSPLDIGGQFYSHYLPFNRPGHTVYLYKHPVPSFVLHYISSFWLILFTNKKTFLTFKPQTQLGNKLNDVEFISSELLSGQLQILCSLKVTSELYFVNKQFGDKPKRQEESKPLQCLLTKDRQDLISTDFHFLGLPLSQDFAFQLVKVFGSPGVPMESLLPDEYVSPLDWKTVKMIYLQWKMSVEVYFVFVFWYRGSNLGPCTWETGAGTTELNPQPLEIYFV
ncbi:hypothetical protein GW7_01099 [Heterocephalus glaber]|uniref:Uncharacterized protein n=1 Tax=Heterocephalus glaber TaxID=10181 RepID=G5B7X8_HETGA|nr:hypothetical protein GW7_01099 [Heterocephalus glaber]